MKNKLTIAFIMTFFCVISFTANSQNLVPNPSFEDTVACPNFGSAINLALGWSSYRQSPDYFNSCNSSNEGVPSNFAGFQYAKTGNAYAGIICYYTPSSNLREYIGIQLSQPLIVGQQYFLSFYAAMAFRIPTERFGIAISKIGAQFSTTAFSNSNPFPIDNYAQVYTDSIIIDTLNWTKISGSFIADSAYNYFIIGNFFDDSLTSRVILDTNALYSYYYIDDIRLSTDSNFVNSTQEFNSNDLIKIFPNPTREWIEVNGNDMESIVIYDVLGRLVVKIDPVSNSQIEINIRSFSKGMYLLNIKMKSRTVTKKIIIQ